MKNTATAVAGLIAGAILASAVHAAEITVLSGGAIEPGLHAAAAVFEKQTKQCTARRRCGSACAPRSTAAS